MRDSRASGAGRRGLTLVGYAIFAVVLATLLASCIDVPDPGQWFALTPSDQHIVYALAEDPFDTSFVYAGSTGGSVYRAYAANRANGVAGAGIPSDAVVSSLAADVKTPGLIYAGTSDGFYASTDRGDHWALRGSGLPSSDTVDAMAVSAPDDTIFAGTTTHGVYASVDAGQTWSAALSGLPANANINTLFWESSSQTLFAAVDGVGVFASADRGASWTNHNAGLSTHAYAFVAQEPSAATTATGATLYVGTGTGLFTSADGGQTWSSLKFAHRVQALALDPQHATWLYAGTDTDVYRSQDDGRSWSSLAPGISHSVTSLLAVVPSGQTTVLFAGAGPLLRFPPYPSGTDSNPILAVISLVGIVAAIFYVFYRNQQRMAEANSRLPLGLQPGIRKKKGAKDDGDAESPEPVGIDQYLSMMTAPTPKDPTPAKADEPERPEDKRDIEN